MAKQTIFTRIKKHGTAVLISGVTTVTITYDALLHMQEHNDWSPLALLISVLPNNHSRVVRAIISKSLQGWTYRKNPKKDFGGEFVKIKDANQGFDLTELKRMVDKKAPLFGADIKAWITPEKATAPAVWTEEQVDAAVNRLVKQLSDKGVEPGSFVVKLQAKLAEANQKEPAH